MPQSKKPRKKYKPKTGDGTGGYKTLLDKTWMSKASVMDLQIYAESAFNYLTKGTNKLESEERMNSLVFMVNVSMILAERIAPEHMEVILRCRDALAECYYASQKRAKGKVGPDRDLCFGLSGEAISAMPEWLLLNNELLNNCKYGEARQAIGLVYKRIEEGLVL